MKAAKSLTELAQELERQAARRHDVVVDTRELTVLAGGEGTSLHIPNMDELVPQDLFHRQLGQHLKIRADHYDRFRRDYPDEFNGLVNGMLRKQFGVENNGKAIKRMIRTYRPDEGDTRGTARCLLSDRYRRIDNYPLASQIMPIIAQIPGVQVPACELTETRMYIKVIAPGVSCNLDDLITPGQHEFYDENDPDTVFAGFVLTNSEVGAAALSVEHMIYRVRCRNGLIIDKALRRNHVGAKLDVAEDYSIYSDETLKADDAALMLKVRDAVQNAVDDTKFRALATQFAETKQTTPLEDPIQAMEVLKPTLALTDGEGKAIMQHLLAGGDFTKFGAINAITRAAHDVESYDRSVELEQLGATVLAMPTTKWDKLAGGATRELVTA